MTVTDSEDDLFTATAVVNILDRTDLDLLVQDKLNNMKAMLMAGDIETALTYFTGHVQERYGEIFTQLEAVLPDRVGSIEQFHLLNATEELIEAEAIRDSRGDDLRSGLGHVWCATPMTSSYSVGGEARGRWRRCGQY